MTHGKQSFLKPHGEGKTDFLTQMCLKPEREMPLPEHPPLITRQDSLEKFLTTPGSHSKLRGSILGYGGHPARHTSLFGVRTHRTVSFWEVATSHHSHVGIPLIPYHLKLLLNPTMDLFLSVSGWQDFKYFEILGRECFPFKLTPLCR